MEKKPNSNLSVSENILDDIYTLEHPKLCCLPNNGIIPISAEPKNNIEEKVHIEVKKTLEEKVQNEEEKVQNEEEKTVEDDIKNQHFLQFNEEDLVPMDIVVEKLHTKTKYNNFKITSDELLRMIHTDEFILNINRNLIILYTKKLKKYKDLCIELSGRIREDGKQLNKLKITLYNARHIEDRFPMIETNIVLREKIYSLIETAEKKIIHLLSNDNPIGQTRDNLIQAITDPTDGILSIIGNEREDIRQELFRYIFILSRTSNIYSDMFLNMMLLGGSGLGKTKISQVVGHVCNKIGIMLTKNVITISPKDLVSKWVGDTATKTSGVLMSGLEGVIFIDEAYQIANEKMKSHGNESLAELVNFIDKFIGLSVVIVAGYKDKMEENFIGANEGIERRFPFRHELSRYSPIDLTNIFLFNLKKTREIEISSDIDKYTYSMITYLDKFNVFRNQSGDMLNLTLFYMTIYYSMLGTLDNKDVMLRTFHMFLESKGLSMNITDNAL
jgi:hypothetical protein